MPIDNLSNPFFTVYNSKIRGMIITGAKQVWIDEEGRQYYVGENNERIYINRTGGSCRGCLINATIVAAVITAIATIVAAAIQVSNPNQPGVQISLLQSIWIQVCSSINRCNIDGGGGEDDNLTPTPITLIPPTPQTPIAPIKTVPSSTNTPILPTAQVPIVPTVRPTDAPIPVSTEPMTPVTIPGTAEAGILADCEAGKVYEISYVDDTYTNGDFWRTIVLIYANPADLQWIKHPSYDGLEPSNQTAIIGLWGNTSTSREDLISSSKNAAQKSAKVTCDAAGQFLFMPVDTQGSYNHRNSGQVVIDIRKTN